MTKGKLIAAVLMAAVLGFGPSRSAWAQAQGSTGTDAAPAAAADPGALSDGEKAAMGCGVAAVGGLAATYIAGPSEITLLWGGGMLVPGNSIMLAVALLGQIGASACAIGAVATPTVLWAYDQSGAIAAKLSQVSDGVGRRVMLAFGQGLEPARQLADGGAAR
ncbi:MAG: hypothetical protein WCO00_02090 [Rhodospirillaceae bacterium]